MRTIVGVAAVAMAVGVALPAGATTVDQTAPLNLSPWRPTGTFGEAFVSKVEITPDAELGLETAVHVRAELGTALRLTAIPTTPCPDRAACRVLGESYFVGPLANGYELYAMWTWRGAIVLWGAPLANRPVP